MEGAAQDQGAGTTGAAHGIRLAAQAPRNARERVPAHAILNALRVLKKVDLKSCVSGAVNVARQRANWECKLRKHRTGQTGIEAQAVRTAPPWRASSLRHSTAPRHTRQAPRRPARASRRP